MERQRRESSFDKNRQAWIGLTGAISPWTFQHCYGMPAPKDPYTNTSITFEDFKFTQQTYRASQVFVEHIPEEIYPDQVVLGEFHNQTSWGVLKINPRAVRVQDETPNLRFYLEFDRKCFPDVSTLPFSPNGDNLIIYAAELKEKKYKGVTVRNTGPLQYFSIDSLEFIIKYPDKEILVVCWQENDDSKISTYSLPHIRHRQP